MIQRAQALGEDGASFPGHQQRQARDPVRRHRPIVRELIAAGVPRDHIVMGFHPPELRPDTEFAVA